MDYYDLEVAAVRRRITLDIEEELLHTLDELASRSGVSRNQCIVQSVEKFLRDMKRRLVDRAFLEMAEDPACQAEMARMEAEMAPLSDEAWLVMDRAEQATGGPPPPRTRRGRRA